LPFGANPKGNSSNTLHFNSYEVVTHSGSQKTFKGNNESKKNNIKPRNQLTNARRESASPTINTNNGD
jgi:hypothetical protein